MQNLYCQRVAVLSLQRLFSKHILCFKDAVNHTALDCTADALRVETEESFWRGVPWRFRHGVHVLDKRTMQSLDPILTKNAFFDTEEPYGCITTEKGSQCTIFGTLVQFRKERKLRKLSFNHFPPLLPPFDESKYSNQVALAKAKQEYDREAAARAEERLENWREVTDYQREKQVQLVCDPSDGGWYQWEPADVGQKEKIIVHLPDGVITAIMTTRSRTGKTVSSLPPELSCDQLAVYDEDSVRNTLREPYTFDAEEQKMFDKLTNEASLKIVPDPHQTRQRLRKADADQRDRVRHIDYTNLKAEEKLPEEVPAADFWKVTKKQRPKPMKKQKVPSDSETSDSEPSSEEELPTSDIELDDQRHRDPSLAVREEQKIEKVSTALTQFQYPKCAELLLHCLDDKPTMTVQQLIDVEPDIFRSIALTGQAQTTLAVLQEKVQEMQDKFTEIHEKVLQEQKLLTELEKAREEKQTPEELQKSIAAQRHEFNELQRKTEHLKYIHKVEYYNQDVIAVMKELQEKKRKLRDLVDEVNNARDVRKSEEKRAKAAKQDVKTLKVEKDDLEIKLKELKETVSKARTQLKKLDRKKDSFKSYCAKYEKATLAAATDLNRIENQLRKIDKTIGYERKVLRKSWQKMDGQRKQMDSLRYCGELRQLVGKTKANRIKKDADASIIDLTKFELGETGSNAVENFVFETSEPKLKELLKEQKEKDAGKTRKSGRKQKPSASASPEVNLRQKKGTKKNRDGDRKRKRSYTPEVRNGPAPDPRLTKKRKVVSTSQPTMVQPKKTTTTAMVATQPTRSRKKKKKKKKAKKVAPTLQGWLF